jgi:hypothetical protein
MITHIGIVKKSIFCIKTSAGNIFPADKSWSFTYNQKWMNSGFCNASLKHMFFGAPNPLLIIHENMRSQRTDMRPGGRTECCKLLKRLHDMIPTFGKNQDSGWDVSENSA